MQVESAMEEIILGAKKIWQMIEFKINLINVQCSMSMQLGSLL